MRSMRHHRLQIKKHIASRRDASTLQSPPGGVRLGLRSLGEVGFWGAVQISACASRALFDGNHTENLLVVERDGKDGEI